MTLVDVLYSTGRYLDPLLLEFVNVHLQFLYRSLLTPLRVILERFQA